MNWYFAIIKWHNLLSFNMSDFRYGGVILVLIGVFEIIHNALLMNGIS